MADSDLVTDQRRRWDEGERVRVEDYLGSDPTLREDRELLLDLIYTEILLREERGERPALEEYIERFPDLADLLRDQFAVHQALGDAADDGSITRLEDTVGPQRTWDALDCGPFGPIELLGEIGRGGMGVVYKARQPGLRRLVAVKTLLAGPHASAEHRQRFRAEAEAVARLRHPHIVQVHHVGEHQGLPFLVLELVEGDSLANRVGRPWDARDAAELGETLSRAVAAAHDAGVVHRDLKPTNILFGTDGQPKITDFGLAKVLDEDSGLTESGDLLGTPAYMAPEQALGAKGTGPACDVYALGVVLYQLVTGRLPFQGATRAETLALVIDHEPVPPRRLQPRLPRDLETITLKCLEKVASKRYPSAHALADDLRCFLDDRAIVARPTPAWERAGKWARRRPAAAALIAVALLAALGIVLLTYEANRRIDAQRRVAERRLEDALDVIDALLVRFSQGRLYNVPRLTALRKELLAEAASRLRALERGDPPGPGLRVRLARTHVRLAESYRGLDATLADQQAEEAASLLARLPAIDFRDAWRVRGELANLQVKLLRDQGRFDEALRRANDGLDALAKAIAATPEDADAREARAQGTFLRGWVHQDLKGFDAAIADFLQVRAHYGTLLDGPNARYARQEYARACHFLGWVHSDVGRNAEAERHYGESIPMRESLIAEDPSDVQARADVGYSHNNLVTVLRVSRQWQKANAQAERLRAHWARMVEDFPEIAEYRSMLGLARMNSGLVDLERGGHDEPALTHFEEAVADQRAALAAEPNNRDVQVRLAWALEFLAQAALRVGRHEAAVTAAREVVAMAAVRDDPALDLRNLAGHLALLADARGADVEGRAAPRRLRDEALDLLRQALGRGLRDRDEARLSDDFVSLRDDPRFRDLFLGAGVTAP